MSVDRCVCCGAIIPEGTMVCPDCINAPAGKRTYDPMTDGAIIAIRIYLQNGYQPMAELAFAFGGKVTIRWDDVIMRNKYAPGINAYTLMFDERTRFTKFEDHVKTKTNNHGNMVHCHAEV